MPLYRAVKRALLGAIESARFGPGDTLPSEARAGGRIRRLDRHVRKAVDELVAEHIVVRRQGRGTFVATHDASRFMFQFFHVERGDGLRERSGGRPALVRARARRRAAAQALGLKRRRAGRADRERRCACRAAP